MEELINRLNKHPHLKARMEALLDVAENVSGEFEKADDAEFALVEGIRKIGQDLLQDWAMAQNAAKEAQASKDRTLKRHLKKNFTGNPLLDQLQ